MQSSSMQDGKKEFKVGQKWKSRDGGTIIEIVSITGGGNYPVLGSGYSWDLSGYYSYNDGDHFLDLVELIEDVASEDKQDNKYSVEEVITTLLKVSNYNLYGFIPDIKEHLSKTKDPEYQKYLELKAKFE